MIPLALLLGLAATSTAGALLPWRTLRARLVPASAMVACGAAVVWLHRDVAPDHRLTADLPLEHAGYSSWATGALVLALARPSYSGDHV